MNIILASASPRRKEILENAGLEFSVCVAEIDETVEENLSAEKTAIKLAEKKASTVAKSYPNHIVLGVDTVVAVEDKILGKPKSEEDAVSMLKTLSGREHFVCTGVCIISKTTKKSFCQKTKVKFYNLTDEEIREYVKTGEPMDKAGAYGIQGKGCVFVQGIEGDYFNVVGLPVARTVKELKKMNKKAPKSN
ncbi:MAG TPA: Maf family protein [Clostridia bacterium]|nr:Maf family protein [Clostridia bacterium]